MSNLNDYKYKIFENVSFEISFIESTVDTAYYWDGIVSFEDYLVNIESIEGTKISDFDKNTEIKLATLNEWALETKMECNQFANNINLCESIKLQSRTDNEFSIYDEVQSALRVHSEEPSLLFGAANAGNIRIECKDCAEEGVDYVLFGFFALFGVMALLSLSAYLFNKGRFPKCPGFNVVDDANWLSVGLFAVQVWDFYSGISCVDALCFVHSLNVS